VQGIQLVVGLGNPGTKYAETRHNAGFWFLAALRSYYGLSFSADTKFKAEVARATFDERTVWFTAPTTFMNLSGQAVASIARFYKIPAEEILVIHDELDLPPGTVRFKEGGGCGGHNGLTDIAEKLGSKNFKRLRIGIGHPGDGDQVIGYVLKRPTADEQKLIVESIDRARAQFDRILRGEYQVAMNELHARTNAMKEDNK
jgi:PTH1 family peptidyl-tRNA hydrolase